MRNLLTRCAFDILLSVRNKVVFEVGRWKLEVMKVIKNNGSSFLSILGQKLMMSLAINYYN
ncbi:hypothetical protein ACL0VS_16340 [Chryseobacterium sp. PMSZPI]|uniref:hypothetical protein n=1 Tax=Chryseobacterium sp. PMSZPI TaxID=1033900 RepID=UPI0039A1BDD4